MYNLIKKEKDHIIQIKSSDTEDNSVNNKNGIIKSDEHIVINDHKECKYQMDKINLDQRNDNNIMHMYKNQTKINKSMDKIEYPIVIIVDNFYMQKEFYNLLLHTNDDKVKNTDSITNPNNNHNNNNSGDNNFECDKHLNILIKDEKENKITDNYITDDSVSSQESFNNNNDNNVNMSNNANLFNLQNNPSHTS